MPHYKIAHVKEQGVDLIVVPLESDFGRKTDEEQRQNIAALQMHAKAAGLAGTVVPVWDGGNGAMAFRAPQKWHPFFQSIGLAWVSANINRELSW